MGRSLTSIVVLAPLALLGACLEMTPRLSVPFQAAADRQARYAAEIALAIKEDRRGEVSEAAANGRMVLPQLPEIWGLPGVDQRLRPAAHEFDLARLEVGGASSFAGNGCTLPEEAPPGGPVGAGCSQVWQSSALVLPPAGFGSIAPAAAVTGP